MCFNPVLFDKMARNLLPLLLFLLVCLPQVLLGKENVNHAIPIERSSLCGHCVTLRKSLVLCVQVSACVCVCVCEWLVNLCLCHVSDCTCVWPWARLVRRSNFPLRLFAGFLQLNRRLARGLGSDISSDPAGRGQCHTRKELILFVSTWLRVWLCEVSLLYLSVCACVSGCNEEEVIHDDLSPAVAARSINNLNSTPSVRGNCCLYIKVNTSAVSELHLSHTVNKLYINLVCKACFASQIRGQEWTRTK